MAAQSPVLVGTDLRQRGLRKLAREVALEQRLVGGDGGPTRPSERERPSRECSNARTPRRDCT